MPSVPWVAIITGRALTAVLAVVILLGELSLLLDWGSRLFGSYVRAPGQTLLRIAALTLAALLLAAPLALLYAGVDTPAVRVLLGASVALSLAEFVHFLFPYRFGIRRLPAPQGRTVQLGAGVVLREVRLSPPALPESLDGLRCLVVSDLHCNSERLLSQIATAIGALEDEPFDLVLLLGDFGGNRDVLPALFEILSLVRGRLGTFCVRGNHDLEGGRGELIERLLERHSMRLLSNAAARAGEGRLVVLGTESPWQAGALRRRDGGEFCIALTHTPDNVFRLQRAGADLCVAGHTHGGRRRFPLIGTLLVPCKYGRFLDYGLFRLKETLLVVTCGLGYPVERLWRRQELLALVLRGPAAGPRSQTGA